MPPATLERTLEYNHPLTAVAYYGRSVSIAYVLLTLELGRCISFPSHLHIRSVMSNEHIPNHITLLPR